MPSRRRSDYRRGKRQTDAVHAEVVRDSRRKWRESHPDYQRNYWQTGSLSTRHTRSSAMCPLRVSSYCRCGLPRGLPLWRAAEGEMAQVDLVAKRIRLEQGTTKNKQLRHLPIFGEMIQRLRLEKQIRDTTFPDCATLFHRHRKANSQFPKVLGCDLHSGGARRTSIPWVDGSGHNKERVCAALPTPTQARWNTSP